MNVAIVSNSTIVIKDASGQPVTTSLAIAQGTTVEHKSVIQSVRAYISDLEEFGRVAFEMAPFETAGGVQQREIAILNEPQSALIISYMRNCDVVRKFKIALVRGFFEMRAELTSPSKSVKQQKAPDTALAAIRTAKALQMNIESAAAIRAMFPSLGEQSHQVILSKIVGGDVIPLPLLENRTYTATEVAEKLGTSANAIGRSANSLGLKTTQYGIFVLDKSKSSDKQVETFRYNDAGVAAVAHIAGLLGVAA